MEKETNSVEQPTENPIITERRIGKFSVHRDMLHYADPVLLRDFMTNFLIVRAEMMFVYDAIEYTAYSHLFEPVSGYLTPPVYTLRVGMEDGKIVKYITGKL